MRKKINILLGALIALLCGCKTQQTPIMQENRPMLLYGPPAYFEIPEPLPQDSTESTTLNNSKLL
jgi:hypothetical protein